MPEAPRWKPPLPPERLLARLDPALRRDAFEPAWNDATVLAASLLSARRATAVDPVEALRVD